MSGQVSGGLGLGISASTFENRGLWMSGQFSGDLGLGYFYLYI